jgi:hypothetical protein
MEATAPRPLHPFDAVDFGGLGNFVLALWGSAVVVRGAVVAACPGCHTPVAGPDLVMTGTLLLAVSSILVWARGGRLMVAAIVAPGVATTIALVLVPQVPLHVMGLALVPSAIVASRSAIRTAGPRAIAGATWVFGLTALVAASATGLVSAAAAGVVVVCVLAMPGLLVVRRPFVRRARPDDGPPAELAGP